MPNEFGSIWTYFLAGELLAVAAPFLEQQMHPTVIISAYRQALEDLVDILKNKVRYVKNRNKDVEEIIPEHINK